MIKKIKTKIQDLKTKISIKMKKAIAIEENRETTRKEIEEQIKKTLNSKETKKSTQKLSEYEQLKIEEEQLESMLKKLTSIENAFETENNDLENKINNLEKTLKKSLTKEQLIERQKKLEKGNDDWASKQEEVVKKLEEEKKALEEKIQEKNNEKNEEKIIENLYEPLEETLSIDKGNQNKIISSDEEKKPTILDIYKKFDEARLNAFKEIMDYWEEFLAYKK